MSCCESRRSLAPALLAALPPAASRPVPPQTDSIQLRYTGSVERALRGPVSGHVYRVGQGRSFVSASSGDAEALLRTGLFMRMTAA
jgi:hypothetical protein